MNIPFNNTIFLGKITTFNLEEKVVKKVYNFLKIYNPFVLFFFLVKNHLKKFSVSITFFKKKYKEFEVLTWYHPH